MLLADTFPSPTPTTVTVAIERIVAACQPRAIFAFGSRARDQARPDSDLDLCVVLHSQVPDRGTLRCHLRELLADMPFAKDILVTDSEAFAQASARINSVYRNVAEEGFPLWSDGFLNSDNIERVCRNALPLHER